MSADNGHILRRNSENKFVLHEYSASAYDYPPINSKNLGEWTDVMDALKAYQNMEEDALDSGYPLSEYGLTVRI